MDFTDKKRFWVIFDTSTLREYYQDVHNLIALPSGASLRYEYREKYLSPSALTAALKPQTAPSAILLVYAQWRNYTQGNPPPSPTVSPSEMLWIPTRFAEMQLIPSPEGANFFFDFKVLGYPNANDNGLLRILTPLIPNGEVPYTKWVCLSDDLQAFDSLHRGKNSDNWQSVVDKLGTPPVQFFADSFMRLKGPYKDNDGIIVQPSYIEEKQTTDGQIDIRKITSLYDLDENESYSFEIISYSPPPSDVRSSEAQRKVTCQTDKDGPLSFL